MSLKVYVFREQVPDGVKIHTDVELLFAMTAIPVDDYYKQAFKEIDGGTVISNVQGISGLTGTGMWLFDMSTGCKAALCVPHVDGVVSMLEVGRNARDFILTHVRTGAIVLDRAPTEVIGTSCPLEEVKELDVMFGSHKVESLAELDELLEGDMFDHEDWYKS